MKVELKRALILTVFSMFLFSQVIQADEAVKEEAAMKDSRTWLSLVDEGKYSESWDEAAQQLKTVVSKERWKELLKSRIILGKVLSRKFQSKQYTKTLPAAPDGEYAVIKYESSFENKKSVIETITQILEKDGKWRVAGYRIKWSYPSGGQKKLY